MSLYRHILQSTGNELGTKLVDRLTREVGLPTKHWIDEDIIARKLERYGPKIITLHPAHMFSQNYEDSNIAEIYDRIGAGSSTFVEIGVESGIECNTRLLLLQGWRGLWIEGNQESVRQIEVRFKKELSSGQLTLCPTFLTKENVTKVLEEAGFGDEVDFLSVDVDMNTHHIWEAIRARARVACIEYNASFPPTVDFGIPYDPGAAWDGTNWFGASLKRLEMIGRLKEMSLVGCDTVGVNAFFVSNDLLGDHFLAPFEAATHYEPARYCLLKTRGHRKQQ